MSRRHETDTVSPRVRSRSYSAHGNGGGGIADGQSGFIASGGILTTFRTDKSTNTQRVSARAKTVLSDGRQIAYFRIDANGETSLTQVRMIKSSPANAAAEYLMS